MYGPTRRSQIALFFALFALACSTPVDDEGPSGNAAATAVPAGGPRPLRLGLALGAEAATRLSTFRYSGGFDTKTLIFETLVREDADGRIIPALAESWRVADEGREWVFRLREGATFHDETPVQASAVCLHFRRFAGLPEHAWLPMSARIESVEALSDREIRIRLDRPHAILPELLAINPCSITAPGMFDREGEFTRPIGTGAWAWKGAGESGRLLRYGRARPLGAGRDLIDIVRLSAEERADPLPLLASGAIDWFLEGWRETVPRAVLIEVPQRAPGLEVHAVAGSSMVYASFRLDGPTAEINLRRRLRALVDRRALIAGEGGFATPAAGWVPRARKAGTETAASEVASLPEPLVILADDGDPTLVRAARLLAASFSAKGVAAEERIVPAAEATAAAAEGRFDLRLERTWGRPYDPHLSLVARFLPPPLAPTATSPRYFGVDPRLEALVAQLPSAWNEDNRQVLLSRIQELMDEEVLILPLIVPHRIAIARAGAPTIRFGEDLYRFDY